MDPVLPLKLPPVSGETADLRHPVFADVDAVLKDCDVDRLRRGGPGGQHRNKVETAVRITHRPTGIVAEANEHRSQEENRKNAVTRLRMRLALDVRTPPLDEPVWHENTHHGRVTAKPTAKSGPLLVAHVLNVLEAAAWKMGDAAKLLGVSSSQLIAFLAADGAVWAKANELRAARGLHALKRR